MKKILAISLMIFFSAAYAAVTTAAEWKLFEKAQLPESGQPSSIQLVGAVSLEDNAKGSPAINQSQLGSPEKTAQLTMGQLRLSFIDIAPDAATSTVPETHLVPMIDLYTGVQTGKFQDILFTDAFNENIDWSASTFILFFGVNLNVGPGYFQSNAFMSRPPENGAFSAAPKETGFLQDKLMATNAKGFNAAAGYKLNSLVTLEAGYGYVEHSRNQAKSGDEAWAIYAQAILNLAPGVQVIPEIGQIDFDKTQPKNSAANNFYAGAKWEINF
ncbi:MAG: hypothetical protein V2B19_30480 [Pseudomonadota bacterium]